MVSDSEKLKNFRKSQNLSQAKLAQILGVKQTSIAMIEQGTRPVTANFKLSFLKTYGVDWDTQIVDGTTYTFGHLENKEISNNIVLIPFYSAKAAAGKGELLPDYPEKDIMYFDARWFKYILGINPDNASIIQAVGDSMDGGAEPIKNGDLLIVDNSVKDIINEKIFVIQLNNSELVVKKVIKDWDGTVRLISNNPIYEDRVVKEFENAEIIGRVVWNSSKERM